MLNRLVIMGRLAQDPESRKTSSGTSVASFRIACEDSYKRPDGSRDTLFLDCSMFGPRSDNLAMFFHKGDPIILEGRLRQRKYTSKTGQEVTATELMADNFEFAGSKETKPEQKKEEPKEEPKKEGGGLEINVDDLPF